MDDIRYSEFVFLRELAARSVKFEVFCHSDQGAQTKAVGLDSTMYVEMATALLEDLYIRFDDVEKQRIVVQLRGEGSTLLERHLGSTARENPRSAIQDVLTFQPGVRLRITYRGLRRIEELPSC